jgi:hypothetical protein
MSSYRLKLIKISNKKIIFFGYFKFYEEIEVYYNPMFTKSKLTHKQEITIK